jgi:hypothetical protein
MSFINDAILGLLKAERAEVFFVSGAATKWWNAQRQDKKSEVALLGGWYWTLNGEENGPFRTSSGAWRDCYYRRLLEQKPPCMGKDEVARAERELRQGKRASPPRSRSAAVERLRA